MLPTQVDIHSLCDSDKDKQQQDCCNCRHRKPSHLEKFEDHLKELSYVNEKAGVKNSSDEKQKPSAQKTQQQLKGMVDQTDFIGNFLGPIGKWQLRTIFLIYLTKIPSSWFMSCVSLKFIRKPMVS